MQLGITRHSYNCVDAADLEQFIQSQYNRPYNVVSALQTFNDNDALHIAEVALTHTALDGTGKIVHRPGVGPESLAQIAAWQTGEGGEPTPEILLSDLASRNLIPAGDYLIDICW
ncbi:hypothetical protein ABR737_01025 [Streptomyces sp. Edi2]|uniref:hypothetical protein n=1 Tax=Streptomyces sp. Edi2 TaxID=3162528 RepID=UPI003305EF5E